MIRENPMIKGVSVSVYTAGRSQDAPVVLLHGGGLMGATWARVGDQISADHFCVAPDLRGHGDTDWDPHGRYSLAGYAADLIDLLDHYSIVRPHVVGMSLGGQTALQAVCHGLDVRTLTLVDVGPRLVPGGGRRIAEFLHIATYPDFDAALASAQKFNPRRSPVSLAASLKRSMRQSDDGRWTWKWDPRRLATRFERTEQAEALWPLIPAIDRPVLLVRGGQSEVLSDALAREFIAELPDGRLVTVADAGHAVQSDRPDLLAAILQEFWTESAAKTASSSPTSTSEQQVPRSREGDTK